MKFYRGDVVWWWSKQSGVANRSKAVFVGYDPHFPKEDCLLAIRNGTKKNHSTQVFRWPLRLVKKVSG